MAAQRSSDVQVTNAQILAKVEHLDERVHELIGEVKRLNGTVTCNKTDIAVLKEQQTSLAGSWGRVASMGIGLLTAVLQFVVLSRLGQ